ncbi:MAG: peptidyl-alpha-hydroxyglycine alpha-amidating lyase family protein [Chloroflexota bacterium]
MIVGEGSYRYEVADGWEHLPTGWHHGDVVDVATDSRDRVFVFNRSDHPVIVYDRDGRFLGSWGEGIFTRPHGITITRDDIVYCADDYDHTVRKFTLDGKLLQTLGTVAQPSDTGYSEAGPGNLRSIKQAAGPFNRPTRASLASNGDLYISDGYGNARIHRFNAAGELIQSWGEPGEGPGQFNLPHSVWVHTDDTVWVCDRENDRVQIFSPTGELLRAWTNVVRPADLYIDANNRVYLGELYYTEGAMSPSGKIWDHERPARVTIRDIDGNLLTGWGGPDPCAPDGWASPHGLWVDRFGDIYVGEVTHTALSRINKYKPTCHSLVKLVRA